MNIIYTAILAMSFSTIASASEGSVLMPASNKSANQDQLIDRIMIASGMKKSLQKLSAQIATGFMNAALTSGANTDEKKDLVKGLEKALPKDVFAIHVSNAMKNNYDAYRFEHFFQLLSTELAKRMLELETQEPKPADVQTFFAQLAKQPLPSERINMIQRLDAATQSSELLTTMTIASLEARALADGGDCSFAIARIKKMIEESRPKIEKANRSNVQAMLAYTYRDVTDTDLSAYLKIYEDKDSRWVQTIAQAAIGEQFKTSIDKGTQGMKSIIQAHKPRKTMFAPTCGQSESPDMDEPHSEKISNETHAKEDQAGILSARKAVASESKVTETDSKVTTSAREVSPAERLTTELQPSKQAELKVETPDSKIATLGKPAGKAHHYPELGRDRRDCLNLATSAEIIACSGK